MSILRTYLWPKNRQIQCAVTLIALWIAMAILDMVLEPLGILPHYGILNPNEALIPPFSSGDSMIHFLGTDSLGRDVALCILHGAKVSFIVSFCTISLALLIGLSLGLFTGYYGNSGIKKSILQQVSLFIFILIGIYYTIHFLSYEQKIIDSLLLLLSIGIAIGIDRLLGFIPIRKIGLPVDFVVQRLFELRESVPGLFIILGIVSIISSPSFYTMACIIAALIWLNFARHARSETLSIKEEDYIKAAKATGLTDTQLIWKHILPNALPPILVIVAFSFSGVILLESTLSFLGIGIPIEEVSWGKLLTEARKTPKAWWLAVFPGLSIFLVLFSFNVLGDYIAGYYRKTD